MGVFVARCFLCLVFFSSSNKGVLGHSWRFVHMQGTKLFEQRRSVKPHITVQMAMTISIIDPTTCNLYNKRDCFVALDIRRPRAPVGPPKVPYPNTQTKQFRRKSARHVRNTTCLCFPDQASERSSPSVRPAAEAADNARSVLIISRYM